MNPTREAFFALLAFFTAFAVIVGVLLSFGCATAPEPSDEDLLRYDELDGIRKHTRGDEGWMKEMEELMQ